MKYYPQEIDFEWNYSEKNHGPIKGPMDSVGGTVKSGILRKVKVLQLNIRHQTSDFKHERTSVSGCQYQE